MDRPGDPRELFAITLLNCLEHAGAIVTYAQYERTVIKSLAKALPELKVRLESLLPRVVDFYMFIRNHFYHPRFHGKLSIKNVLPALAPDLSYENLHLRDGVAAHAAYLKLRDGAP